MLPSDNNMQSAAYVLMQQMVMQAAILIGMSYCINVAELMGCRDIAFQRFFLFLPAGDDTAGLYDLYTTPILYKSSQQ